MHTSACHHIFLYMHVIPKCSRLDELPMCTQEVKQLLAAHEWLVAEEPKFNQSGTPYDFKQLRPESEQKAVP